MSTKTSAVFITALFLLSVGFSTLGLAQSTETFVFLDFPSQVQVVVGSSSIQSVSVKNIGDYVNVVDLSVETTAPISASVTPGSQQIDRGDTGTFSLSLLSSPSDVINRYPSKLHLRGNGVDVTKDFTLVVVPTPEKKFEINSNYLVLLNKYESLNKRFSEVKGSGCVLVRAGDVNAVAPKQIVDDLQTLNDKVEKSRIAIKEDDFVTADVETNKGKDLSNKIDSDINSLRAAQESCEADKARVSGYLTGGTLGTTLGIVVIVALLGLMAYNHYSKKPEIRKLIPSSSPMPKSGSTNLAQHPGVKRVGQGRPEFRYEFRKKDK